MQFDGAHHFPVYEQLNCTRKPCILISSPNDLGCGGWMQRAHIRVQLAKSHLVSRAKRSVQYQFVPLPRPESNWLCPRTSGIRHPLNSLQIRLLFFPSLSFSDSDTFKPAHSHSCSPPPPHPKDFCFSSPIPGPVRLYFLLHGDKKPSGAPGLRCQ